MNETINDYFSSITNHKVRSSWLSAQPRINKEFNILDRMLHSDHCPHIYGVTSEVGHLDSHAVDANDSKSFQERLILNHQLDLGEYYNDWESKCILFAKIQHYSCGGSAVSPELFQGLIDLFQSESASFSIPKHSSYSCGDVIPGSFFAQNVTEQLKKTGYRLSYKDGISLINGMFVQTGLSLSVIPSLRLTLDRLIDNSINYFKCSGANALALSPDMYRTNQWTKRLCTYLSACLPKQIRMTQDAISVRSTPQVIETIFYAIDALEQLLVELLNNPSDNPLIFDRDHILSQSSYFSPELALRLENCINALMFTGWALDRRIHYLLSGDFDKIALNAATDANDLGLIQVPKLVTNLIEEMRLKLGRRVFASGSSTSYGIEDLWSLAVPLIEQAYEAMDTINLVLKIESLIFTYIKDKNYDAFKKNLRRMLSSKELQLRAYFADFKHLKHLA